HPAMRHAAPVRRELAARTVFNVLGPLTNPAGARAQVVGVFAPELVRTIAEVLAQLGARRAFVVHGAYGIDELSPAGPNLVCEVVEGTVRERTVDPLELGVARCAPDALRGRSPSTGDLRPDADPAGLARAFEQAGAAGCSILVDARFGGSWDDLRAARAAATLPLLAKGFFSSEDDLRTARDAGADAVLLLLR